jgi:hypothetical protein
MKTKVKWLVIINIMYLKDTKLSEIKPDIIKYPLFRATDIEKEDQYINRKYYGTLTFEQLSDLFRECSFTDTCQTMGSLTLEYGMLPAISFDINENWYSINAYISPIYDNIEFLESLKDLKDWQLNRVWAMTDKLMKWLENDSLEIEWWNLNENELNKIPQFVKECYFDFQQLELNFKE